MPDLKVGKWHHNLGFLTIAGAAATGAVANEMRQLIGAHYDLEQFNTEVLAGQARRLVVYSALRNGDYFPWDFQPLQRACERYMRNHKNLNEVEAMARFPVNKT